MGKMPELSSNLVAVKGSAVPSADMPPRVVVPSAARRSKDNASAPGDEDVSQSLNFKVTDDFKREYKSYAASQGMKLNELLRRSYQVYREHQGN